MVIKYDYNLINSIIKKKKGKISKGVCVNNLINLRIIVFIFSNIMNIHFMYIFIYKTL